MNSKSVGVWHFVYECEYYIIKLTQIKSRPYGAPGYVKESLLF